MKRLIAFALVLVMALSMMVMTASAALAAEAACTLHPDSTHWKYNGTKEEDIGIEGYIYNGVIYFDDGDSGPNSPAYSNFVKQFADGHVPQDTDAGNWWYLDAVEGVLCRCTGNHGTQPTAQPKTGVMDTLPLWFGVMAVSACAYVLTSKKKVF